MKTTLNIDDALVRDAKAFATRQRKSLTWLIEEGLRVRINARAVTGRAARKPRLPVSPCRGGLLPGINPASNASMMDAADRG